MLLGKAPRPVKRTRRKQDLFDGLRPNATAAVQDALNRRSSDICEPRDFSIGGFRQDRLLLLI